MIRRKDGTMARRDYGEGSVFYDETRRCWVGVLDVPRGAEGRRRRTKVQAATRSEVLRRLREKRRLLDDGLPVGSGFMTVRDLLTRWHDTVVAGRSYEPRTRAQYDWSMGHLSAGLGNVRLQQLTPEMVEDWLRALAERTEGRPFGRSALARLRGTLAAAIRWGEKRGYVHRNVAALAELPAEARRVGRGRALTPKESLLLLDAAKGSRMEAWIMTALLLGLRPAEVGGLTWSSVDLEAGHLAVVQALKWDRGRPYLGSLKKQHEKCARVLALPDPLRRALRAHRVAQAEERLVLGQRWPTEWHDLVFLTSGGLPIDESNGRREVAAIARRAGIGSVSRYDLRHSACSLLSYYGVPNERIADILGHATTRMVDEVYRHPVAGVLRDGVRPMESLFTEAG
jgi:integrase